LCPSSPHNHSPWLAYIAAALSAVRLHVTGDYIKDKYDGATEVRINRRGRLQIRDPRFNKPTANDLVYIDDSPNYCIRNVSVGSLGKPLTSPLYHYCFSSVFLALHVRLFETCQEDSAITGLFTD
jgi:hypothetical protein